MSKEVLSPLEAAKRLAARRAIDDWVKDNQVIGIGSGSTIVYGIQRLAERVREEGIRVQCVPTSFQSKILLCELGIPITDLSVSPVLDVAIDGADEVDHSLNCIKGGGGCQTLEKLVASAAKVFIIVADGSKQSSQLGVRWRKGVPIEVLPGSYVVVSRALRELGGEPRLRMAVAKAGPCVTDNGGLILDADFGAIAEPAALHSRIKLLCGVVETGLFPGMASRAYFGKEDGSVETWDRPACVLSIARQEPSSLPVAANT